MGYACEDYRNRLNLKYLRRFCTGRGDSSPRWFDGLICSGGYPMFRKALSSAALLAALALVAGTSSRVGAQATITSNPYSQYGGGGYPGYYQYPYVYSDL